MAIDGKEKLKLQLLRGDVQFMTLEMPELKKLLDKIDEILDHDIDSWKEDIPF